MSWLVAMGLAGCGEVGSSADAGDDTQPIPTSSDTTAGSESEEGSEEGPGAEDGPAPVCDEGELSDLYTQYVEPFVSGGVASSCSSCHMTGIDIGIYAQDTPCQTMACMVELGVVDLEQPQQSDLLTQIMMGDPGSSVFDIEHEHMAMLEWIEWSASCHGEVCGEVEHACTSGTGASSTGTNPIGDCSEDDLLVTFWDAVIYDRGRCLNCHSDYGAQVGTFGPCGSKEDCSGPQLCVEGSCRAPGPVLAPHMFEGVDGPLDYEDPDDRALGLATMYNVIALGQVDVEDPLGSTLLTKPLLEDFQPLAIYGDGVELTDIPPGTGQGVIHGGTSKFNFGYHEPPFPTSGVVDCRTDQPCTPDGGCGDGLTCIEGSCRTAGSYCDATYARYVRFVEYFASCTSG
ncbi:MAG: hypothetical protein K0V04_14110 [Deltaproteobacteria bacterium]|nr:hypothetical protein [Deltaproteobacteria bacterium]